MLVSGADGQTRWVSPSWVSFDLASVEVMSSHLPDAHTLQHATDCAGNNGVVPRP